MMMLRVVRGTRPRHDEGRLDSEWTTPAFPHFRSLMIWIMIYSKLLLFRFLVAFLHIRWMKGLQSTGLYCLDIYRATYNGIPRRLPLPFEHIGTRNIDIGYNGTSMRPIFQLFHQTN